MIVALFVFIFIGFVLRMFVNPFIEVMRYIPNYEVLIIGASVIATFLLFHWMFGAWFLPFAFGIIAGMFWQQTLPPGLAKKV